jgi:hypothetical protein
VIDTIPSTKYDLGEHLKDQAMAFGSASAGGGVTPPVVGLKGHRKNH